MAFIVFLLTDPHHKNSYILKFLGTVNNWLVSVNAYQEQPLSDFNSTYYVSRSADSNVLLCETPWSNLS